MCVWEIAGGGYFVGRGRGYPTPRNYFGKKCYFSHISPIFEIMGLKKWGVGIPSLGRHPPLKFFWRCKLGLARCFHSHFATVGLVVFRRILAFNMETLTW